MAGIESPAVRIGGRLKASDIPDALTHAPFTYADGATQIFTPDRRTIYSENGVPTVGEWGVTDQGHFWSFWPPNYRADYDVFYVLEDEKVVGVRFIELTHGATSEGRYTPGNSDVPQ